MEYGLGPGSEEAFDRSVEHRVLILVLMEYGLGPNLDPSTEDPIEVLILVLMEYGLGDDGGFANREAFYGS